MSSDHRPIEGSDFMPSGWCGACEHCGPAPKICAVCSYSPDGMPAEPVAWPCLAAGCPCADGVASEMCSPRGCVPAAHRAGRSS